MLPLVYNGLRELAAQKMAQEKPGQTLQGTALVHDAYLKLVGEDGSPNLYRDRGHFFAAAATAMRHILIDNARRKLTEGAAGRESRQPLDEVSAPAQNEELLALDEALEKLAGMQLAARKARLVELRYFAGLTGEQAAQLPWAFPRPPPRPPLEILPSLAPGGNSRRRLMQPASFPGILR